MSTAGPAEIAVLIVIAVLMFGPDKLPEMARKAARIYHYLKNIANNMRDQLRSELGPQFADLDYQDLKPQNFVRKYVLDSLQDDIDEIKADLSNVRSDLDLGLADIRNSEGLPETPVSAPSSVVHDEAVPVPFDLEAT
ncbi:sec-independent translocase [Cutibacterium acnes]|uniref:sec-independent translocase n=1 Tax=Cutibacterium acnes TaxID=1747 RepID=UPI000203F819|nr:sec-independent translocase [Cutibacterium acnes]EGE72888.1 MttA family protein [Cutibacterium acnes HL097PA1]EIA12546.1 sec-independent translocase [Cutibacterium acnes PRP-38]REB13900.1 translocase [Cutibacterium acnes]REB18830.1 translocase [Cutibacterium acnes]TLG14984.1 Sec-independent protein translocase subunit TatB [Cutibacterium acnes]